MHIIAPVPKTLEIHTISTTGNDRVPIEFQAIQVKRGIIIQIRSEIAYPKWPSRYINTLIFTGDVIDRSTHILETLSLVMLIMERNINRVFYIRGNNESNNLWHNNGLKRELIVCDSNL